MTNENLVSLFRADSRFPDRVDAKIWKSGLCEEGLMNLHQYRIDGVGFLSVVRIRQCIGTPKTLWLHFWTLQCTAECERIMKRGDGNNVIVGGIWASI